MDGKKFNSKRGWIALGVAATILTVSILVIVKTKKPDSITTKEQAIEYLTKTIGYAQTIATMDSDYLIGRANAFKNGDTTFKAGNKTYSTATGRAI